MATKVYPKDVQILGRKVIELANGYKDGNRTFRQCLELAAKETPKSRSEYYKGYRDLPPEVRSFISYIAGTVSGARRRKKQVQKTKSEVAQPIQGELFGQNEDPVALWHKEMGNARIRHGALHPEDDAALIEHYEHAEH